jgi:hypothetical protein
MKKNMGSMDKGIRIFLAVIIAVLYFTNQITGVAAIVLGIFAVVLLLTSFVGFCPLYAPLKLSTLKKDEKK